MLAASVHAGRHEEELVQFVKDQLDELNQMPTAFISVSLTEVNVEKEGIGEEQREAARNQVQQVLDSFFEETGWHPSTVKPVAGALLYTQYGVIKRFLMRMISKKMGGPTDTSRDYDFTDWDDLDNFAADFIDQLGPD